MRMKILSLGISFIFLCTSFPVYGDAEPDDSLYIAALTVLRESVGSPDNPDAYWTETIQRYQAVVILSYLMGIEKEIYAMPPDAPNFIDADGEHYYIKQVMAFAMANPQLGFDGYADGTFRPTEYASAQQILHMMSLTYEYLDNVQAAWTQMFAEAAEEGLVDYKLTGSQFADLIAILNESSRRTQRVDTSSTSSKPDCTGRKPSPGFHARLAENFKINNLQTNRFLGR